jgi:serpin B
MSQRCLTSLAVLLVILGSFTLPAAMSYAADKRAVADADLEAIVAGNTEFAFDLYSRIKDHPEVKKADGNLFFSPYSISTALAMTYAGARGRTAEQMTETLKFPFEEDLMHDERSPNGPRPLMVVRLPWETRRLAAAFGAMEKGLKAEPKESGYQLSVANALWGQKDYKFLQSFLDLNREYYGAGLEQVDFVRETEKARKTINKWVEKQTKDRIKDLIPRGAVDHLTVLVLTNAIYFKGDWAGKFKEENTEHTDFHITEDKTVKVPMMYQKGRFAYTEGEDAQTLVLPYKGDELSMLIVLPKKIGMLASVESELTSKNLKFELGRMREREVQVYLPKFKMTCGALELKHILKDMGMKDAFSLPPADFSSMTGVKDLFISKVLHKAFVEVNEEGTEAAAATAVVMTRGGPRLAPVFRADRPFIFMIRDNRSGSILFMGRVVNPAEQVE